MTVLNGITTQYYVALASLRGRYFLLNRDLKALLTEARSLNTNQSAEFKTTCCSLADRLEKLARSQCEAQGLVERLVRTYQVQMMCMMTIYYLNLVGNLYIVLIFSKNWVLTKFWFNEEVLCFTFITVYYFIDCWISLYNTFYLLDAHEEMIQLLSERTLFKSGLDKRLEAVIDTFTLNLAQNPLEIRYLGLHKNDRFSSFAVLDSFLNHIIILIQYGMENF
nr:putative gustatory receptor 59d [Drosophila suzukii]